MHLLKFVFIVIACTRSLKLRVFDKAYQFKTTTQEGRSFVNQSNSHRIRVKETITMQSLSFKLLVDDEELFASIEKEYLKLVIRSTSFLLEKIAVLHSCYKKFQCTVLCTVLYMQIKHLLSPLWNGWLTLTYTLFYIHNTHN